MTGQLHYDRYDEVAVTEMMAGRYIAFRPRTVDRAEAVRRLNSKGYTDGQIAYRLNCPRRTVHRIRRRRDIPTVYPVGCPGGLNSRPHPDAPARPAAAG